MAIFKRQETVDGQASTAPAPEASVQGGSSQQTATLMPPYVAPRKPGAAPGVVPPPAAPLYSMQLPESKRFEFEAESSVAGRTQAPGNVQKRVRVAVERSAMPAPASAARRHATQRRPVASRPAALSDRASFDPVRCAQTGLLNLAWNWQQSGAPIRAIHAYMQVLSRYPDTAAAEAAVADLVELSDSLTETGQFHLALAIYDELERLL